MFSFLENWASDWLWEAFMLVYEWLLGDIICILSFDLEVWIQLLACVMDEVEFLGLLGLILPF